MIIELANSRKKRKEVKQYHLLLSHPGSVGRAHELQGGARVQRTAVSKRQVSDEKRCRVKSRQRWQRQRRRVGRRQKSVQVRVSGQVTAIRAVSAEIHADGTQEGKEICFTVITPSQH